MHHRRKNKKSNRWMTQSKGAHKIILEYVHIWNSLIRHYLSKKEQYNFWLAIIHSTEIRNDLMYEKVCRACFIQSDTVVCDNCFIKSNGKSLHPTFFWAIFKNPSDIISRTESKIFLVHKTRVSEPVNMKNVPIFWSNSPVKIIEGDMFNTPIDFTLVHCVSKCLSMDRWISGLFIDKFGGKQELIEQNKDVGQIAYYKRNGRLIMYLITKEESHSVPSYENFKRSLIEMRSLIEINGIKRICIPKNGLYLDRLKLPVVKRMLEEVFFDSKVLIDIYELPLGYTI